MAHYQALSLDWMTCVTVNKKFLKQTAPKELVNAPIGAVHAPWGFLSATGATQAQNELLARPKGGFERINPAESGYAPIC